MSATRDNGVFATTHWSVVLAAGDGASPAAAAALERLCRTYWFPLYAHPRRRGRGPDDAAELTQELFARPLRRQLCGWDSAGEVPGEPTFSRAFAAFAADQLAQQVHEHMVRTRAGPKLVGHVSRDATAIEAPERPAPKPAPAVTAPRKRGRPRQGEVRPPAPPRRLELQPARTLAENLADLPARCDVGCKRNSKGHQESWTGYKLHWDTVDGDFPVSAVLTSASVHDSQVAIPLAQLTAQRWVRVRGAAKVMCHLMLGLVALTATALFARLF